MSEPESHAERRRTPRDPEEGDPVLPYSPVPLGDLPLCIPLPAAWYDDPGYRLVPYGYVGCDGPPRAFGVLGTALRRGEQIAMSYDGAFAHAYFGPPGSGKTYLEGVQLESALLRNRYQTRLLLPRCGIAVSYSRGGGGGHGVEALSARLPNQDPREVRALLHEHGTLPEGFADVVCLASRRSVPALRRAHPHCQVRALAFSCRELGVQGLMTLMAMDARDDSLLAAEIGDLLGTLPAGFGKDALFAAVAAYPFRDRRLRKLVERRLALCEGLLDDRADLRGLVAPGRLLVIDLQDGWLAEEQAMRMLQVILSVLVLGEGPPPCALLLCLDEAHKLLSHKVLRQQIEYIIRERRHLQTSVILSTQDPLEVPHSTLAELDGVGLFQTGSARSLRHLARDIEAFSALRPADLSALRPGQLVLWSRQFFTPYAPGELDGKLLRMQVRPRLSHHGGATRNPQ